MQRYPETKNLPYTEGKYKTRNTHMKKFKQTQKKTQLKGT